MKHGELFLKEQQRFNKKYKSGLYKRRVNFLTSPRTRSMIKWAIKYLDNFDDVRFYFSSDFYTKNFKMEIQIGVEQLAKENKKYKNMGICRPTFYSDAPYVLISYGDGEKHPYKIYQYNKHDTKGLVELTNNLIKTYYEEEKQ